MKIVKKSELENLIAEVHTRKEEYLKEKGRSLDVGNYKNHKNLPTLYQDAWLENCNKKITDWVENLLKQYEQESEKIEEYKEEKEGLYIYGSAGTGKTYALYAIFRNHCLNNEYCKIINTVELLRLFKKDFKDEYEHNFEEYLEFSGVLFIDDIGAEKNTEFVDETLYHLINTRHEKMLPTFFTSNLSLKELAEKNGDRLASRIAGMCDVIELTGEDRRLK